MFRWLNIILILATFLSYLSPFVSPETFWLFSLFGLGFPVLLIANILFVIFWAVKKDRYFFFSLGCIFLGWSHFNGFIGLNASTESLSEETINIMTYNVGTFAGRHNAPPKIKDQFAKDFVAYFPEFGNIDILCVQEMYPTTGNAFQAKLDFEYHFQNNFKGIYTNYPIVKKGKIEPQKKRSFGIWMDLKIGKKIIRVYNFHLKSNRFTETTNKIADEGDLRKKETWSDIKKVASRYIDIAKLRAQQAEILAHHIVQSPHPVIICGDMNETPLSYSYKIISENLKDAFCEKGFGLGSTYTGKVPFLRIDYMLTSPKFEINFYKKLDLKFSDHAAISSQINLN